MNRLQELLKAIPLHRAGKPEDVVNRVLPR